MACQSEVASSTTKWQFTTYERDSESGNDYAMARYAVNRLGRFSAPDAIAGSAGNPQPLNRYAYVVDDPINSVDPSGLCSMTYYTDATGIHVLQYDLLDCPIGGGSGGSGGPGRGRIGGNGEITGSPFGVLAAYLAMSGSWRDIHDTDLGGGNSSGPDLIRQADGSTCTPSVFNPSCKKPSCLAVFFNSTANALDLPVFPAGSGPEDAAKAAAATRHIINRGLSVPLRSSIVRGLLGLGEIAANVIIFAPVIYSESVGLKAEYDARKARTCTTAFGN